MVRVLCLLLALAADPAMDAKFHVYRSGGETASLEAIVSEARHYDVIFLGEIHTDPVAHYLEKRLFEGIADEKTTLSLEMFETDTQPVVDEYLQGLIPEEHLMASGRAWKNYKTDYRDLIEYAKLKKLPVLAANAPRRYLNRVSRLGRESLNDLSAQARSYLPPLPYAEPSADYAAKFIRVMEESRKQAADSKSPVPAGEMNIPRALAAQALWDAGMSFSIAQHLTRQPERRVVHVNGSFHTEQHLGTVEHLKRYRPGVRVMVVTMAPSKHFPNFDAESMKGKGDFVIVTQETAAKK
ncbi:ChaN family lipoprotein [Bryobacter aggregatus]|uniref:ChaN family lipoprotein n=1 Tax=Bryobacter aggregatus TaxID=360054 RepID=UPI0006918745|nr:ChaN family lipoprotein [Bryobacter aggregatus]